MAGSSRHWEFTHSILFRIIKNVDSKKNWGLLSPRGAVISLLYWDYHVVKLDIGMADLVKQGVK